MANKIVVYQNSILFLVWLGYCSSYLIRKPLALVKKDLEAALDVNTSQIAWLDIAFTVPYAGVSLFFGWVADAVGARKTFGLGLIVSSLVFGCVPWFLSFHLLCLIFFIVGVAQSLGWPTGGAVFLPWFPAEKINYAFGVYGTSVIGGGIFATYFVSMIKAYYGWESIFVSCAMISGTLGVLILLFGHSPDKYGVVIPSTKHVSDDFEKGDLIELDEKPIKGKGDEPKSFLKMMQLPLMLEVCTSFFCIKFMRYAFLLWLPYFFESALKYSAFQAAVYSCVFDVGAGFGSLQSAQITKKLFNNDKLLTSFGCSLLTALCLLTFYITTGLSSVVYLSLLFLSGVFVYCAEVLLCGSIALDIGVKHGAVVGVSGVVNGVGSLGSVCQSFVVAWVAEMVGWPAVMPLLGVVMLGGAGASYRAYRRNLRNPLLG